MQPIRLRGWYGALAAAATIALGCSSDSETQGGGGAGSGGGPGDSSVGGAGGSGGATPDGAAGQDALAQDAPPSDTATDPAAAAMAAVERQRYVDDLTFIAAPRPPGSTHWQEVQDLCATRLESLGYTVQKQDYGSGTNVVGVLAGKSLPSEKVLVSAHYDHIKDCPGADDNGSGVAGVLEVARVLAPHGWNRSLVVACWDEEESGLIGAEAFAQAAKAASEAIKIAIVFEMIGFRSSVPGSQQLPNGLDTLFPAQAQQIQANQYRGDFVAVIHDAASSATASALTTRAQQVGLSAIFLPVPESLKKSNVISDLRRSDHAPFWDVDYPAINLGDTAEFRNSHYHCKGGDDVVGDLDHDFTTMIIRSAAGAAADALGAE